MINENGKCTITVIIDHFFQSFPLNDYLASCSSSIIQSSAIRNSSTYININLKSGLPFRLKFRSKNGMVFLHNSERSDNLFPGIPEQICIQSPRNNGLAKMKDKRFCNYSCQSSYKIFIFAKLA